MASTPSGHRIQPPKTRKRVEFDFEALAKELSSLDEGEGLTTQEIAEAMNCGLEKARKFIAKALEAGRCRTSRRWITNIAGFRQRYVSYVFEKGDQANETHPPTL